MERLRGVQAVVWKDLRVEWRTRGRWGPVALFVLLVLLVFSLALGGSSTVGSDAGVGVLWAGILLASMSGMTRSFSEEEENRCLDALCASPLQPGEMYCAKMIVNLVFLWMVELVAMPFFVVFFNVTLDRSLLLVAALLALGAVALSAVGTLLGAVVGVLRLRDSVVSVALLPAATPVLIVGVAGTRVAGRGPALEACLPHAEFLTVFTVVFVTLSLLLFEKVLEK